MPILLQHLRCIVKVDIGHRLFAVILVFAAGGSQYSDKGTKSK
jgi:hypothetical protein